MISEEVETVEMLVTNTWIIDGQVIVAASEGSVRMAMTKGDALVDIDINCIDVLRQTLHEAHNHAIGRVERCRGESNEVK